MNKITKAGFTLILMLSAFLSACGDKKTAMTSPAHMPPPPAVTVAPVITKELSNWETFTGRLESSQSVELRPRVSGYIEKVAFTEGTLVKKGDLLFKIDDRHFRIEVQRLEALLGSAQAQINLAVRNVGRASSLKQTNAVSQAQLDSRNTELVKARSDYDNVTASLRSARLDLSFTRVTAPISGRVSKANTTEGNYVAAGQSILTSLVSTDTTFAYFDVNEQSYMKLRMQALTSSTVLMKLVGDEQFSYQGKVDFIDNQIDSSTGTIRLRAVFSNTEGKFTPGMFVRLKMEIGSAFKAVLIDDKAIGTDLSHQYVLVLGKDNKVDYRAITLGGRAEGLRIVHSGLSEGDVIVTKGLQRARPGAVVSPTHVEMVSGEPSKASLNQIKPSEQG